MFMTQSLATWMLHLADALYIIYKTVDKYHWWLQTTDTYNTVLENRLQNKKKKDTRIGENQSAALFKKKEHFHIL